MMRAEIHQLRPRAVATNWMCSACGQDASCNCGAPLMSKAQRAVDAVAANPQRSDRAIAEEIGVGKDTVRRARDATGAHAPVDEARIGLDGKERRMPVRSEPKEDYSPAETKQRERGAFMLRAQEAKNFAFYAGKVDRELIDFAKATSAAWCGLIAEMEKRNVER